MRAPATLNTSALLRHADAYKHMHTLWLLKYRKKKLNDRGNVVIPRVPHSLPNSLTHILFYCWPWTCLTLLKRAENISSPKNSPNTFLFRISKAASQGYMLPPSKNMKQQEENVYWSSLPTSQAEGKIGIFIMKRGRWLFDLEHLEMFVLCERGKAEETCDRRR